MNRSRRTAGREAEVLRQLGKRVDGLRCSRVHPGVCPQSPTYRQREDVAVHVTGYPGITPGSRPSFARTRRAVQPSRAGQNRLICESSH